MRKLRLTLSFISLIYFTGSYAQETLQTVTDRGTTTSNRMSVSPIYTLGSRITAYGYNNGYFDIFNNANNSISLKLKRSDGLTAFEIDGHTMASYFGGNLGLGTSVPKARLDVSGGVMIQSILTNSSIRPPVSSTKIPGEIRGYSGSGENYDDGFIRLSSGGGTTSGIISFIDLTGYSTVPDMDRNLVMGTSGVERMRISNSGNVGIGTTNPSSKLSVNGDIRAKEVKVETANWPDYVFDKDYELPSLKSTEKHITDKGHLPGIPSAADVQVNGVNLGEMNAKLLQKIEELTLHLIQMQKNNDRLTERVEKLEQKP